MSPNIPSGTNPWFGVSMVLIGLVVGYTLSNGSMSLSPSGGSAPTQVAKQPEPSPTPPPPPAKNVPPVTAEDRVRGDRDATISVIEYSDFECPFCARHHPTMVQVLDEIDDVNWVYRHFPLGFHTQAQKAAEASECAGDQDTFWEYADLLFEKGPSNANLVSYAEELGLDATAFSDCLDSGKYAEKVKTQMASGSSAGVSGTPGNVVYNNKTKESRIVSGAQPFSAFQAAIEDLR